MCKEFAVSDETFTKFLPGSHNLAVPRCRTAIDRPSSLPILTSRDRAMASPACISVAWHD